MRYFSGKMLIGIATTFFPLIFHGQAAGFINRPATSVAGRAVLDPNSDGYSSVNSSGFAGNDIANSEIPYKAVPSFSLEPFGDLRRGPDHLYSDFVPDAGSDGFYAYYDATNLLFRFRLGSIMPGSKGYSVLLDTDGKFGASGANADPNYVAATTGVNGNPGFEIEIVLETNFRLAIYNVDGTSSPALITAYTNWQDMSQISISASSDGGDPDFFMDFYIPFSAVQAAPFNLTTSSSLRIVSTTVMSSQAAIGGPKSDLYGLSDDNYQTPSEQYEEYIQAQPPFVVTNLTSVGTGFGAMCTSPPVVTGPIAAGTVSISGTWTASSLAGAVSPATITVYRNGTSVGTIASIASGSPWTLNNILVANGDVITARAQASGESICLTSNSITVLGCTPANVSTTVGAAFSVTCVNDRRGVAGTKPANAVVKLYSMSAGGSPVLFATDGTPVSPSGFNITYSGGSVATGTSWEYNGSNNSGSADPCSGGPNDIANGYYYFTVTEPGKCESVPVMGSCVNQVATATPVITQTNLYNGNVTVSGTAVAGSTVLLYVNNILRTFQTATGGNYSFSNVALNAGSLVTVYAQATGNCISAGVNRTVNCFTTPPFVTSDNNSQIAAGSPVSGVSAEPSGTVIRVYNATGPVLVATTAVQSDGTWSTGNVGTTPSTYNAVAGLTYYATAQNGSCSVSGNSASVSAAAGTLSTRCGTITGPVAASATNISGTLTGSFTTSTVRLYLDGVLLGSTTTNNTNWGPIAVNSTVSNTLYSNGVLTIGIQETGKQEVLCPLSALSITCSPAPVAPVYSPTNSSITVNQSRTYTISNAQAGTFYGIADGTTGQSYGTGAWATSNGSLSLTTNVFTSAGSYNIIIKSTSLSGVSVCSGVSSLGALSVNSALPLTLVSFTGLLSDGAVNLSWITEDEINTQNFEIERSPDGIHFTRLGSVLAAGEGGHGYGFTDEAPLPGIGYYRLKMVDIDGQYTYSRVVQIRFTETETGWRVAPNPVTDNLNFYNKMNVPAMVTIYSSSGQRLFQRFVNDSYFTVSMKSFPSGIYAVQIASGNATITKRIMKK